MLDSASRVSVSIVRRTGKFRAQVVALAPKAISRVSIHTGPQNEPFEAKPAHCTGRGRVTSVAANSETGIPLTNIARLLTRRVHFAAFGRVRSFRQESRKSNAAKDYRCLLIGIPKATFGVRIPVEINEEMTSMLDMTSMLSMLAP